MAEQKRPADQRRLAAYLKNKMSPLTETDPTKAGDTGTKNTRAKVVKPEVKAADSRPAYKLDQEKPDSKQQIPGQSGIIQVALEGTLSEQRASPFTAQDRPGLVKTVSTGKSQASGAETTVPGSGKESKYRKVAKLLIVIGQNEASQILSKLDPEQIEAITKEIALIKTVSKEEGEAILAEFRAIFSEALASTGHLKKERGGIDAARELLHAAFGSEQGEKLLRQAVPEAIENPFQFLEDFTGEQISFLLKDETTPVLALVLSRLSPQKAAEYIKLLPGSRRLELVKRLAKMSKTSPEVVEKVAEVLREKAHKIGRTETTEIDGKSALAAILRYTDPSLGDEILENLEAVSPDLSREIKEKIYTLDDVIRCEDRALQEKLRTMEDRDIALLLKGQKPEFIDKIKSNLSANRRAIIEEERELLGPVPRKDTEAVVQDFLSWFRQGRETGTIRLTDDQDVFI
ncbi:flagellar motor switch protein FliG [Gracilinema caldarium]|uniref:Flagellar motor switch protein FliG n=1 Tax=Gracilinema caldarium (strain ATCC 51460 / DSM 7334 / H1) TaxID=744872 RepID=F8EXS3_GRAC1|nr:flagellar motor switch protein FliG [Gracilinema caldarium]AEJ20087.1 Flagellar motor switch protein FliG, C-terminal [Gracilinema caldarium DSM 7334]